jgi:hypothetical protein
MNAKKSLPDAEVHLSFTQLAVALAIVLAIFTAIFGIWTATSAWSFPRFLLAIVMLIYLPGKLLVDIFALQMKPLEDLTLSLILGMTTSTLLFWISAFIPVPNLFLLWPLAAATVWLYRRKRKWREICRLHLSLDVSYILLFGLIMVSLVPLAVLPMYYRNLDVLSNGTMTFFVQLQDVNLHLPIAQELTHSIPPQIPFFAGHTLNYHLGMDLLVAMLSNSTGLSILDLTVRFMPTFFLMTTILAVFCFSRALLHSRYAAVLATFLVIFGEDFSFVPGLLLNSHGVWSTEFFRIPTIVSLYSSNSMLPALGILFGGLLCLARFHKEKRKTWLFLTAFLFAVAIEFKVFTTMHVLIALAIASCIYLLLFRDPRFIKVLVLTALLAFPFVLYIWLGNQAGGRIWVRLDPLTSYIPKALASFGLLDTPVGYHTNTFLNGGIITLKGFMALFLVVLPVYLLGSLGTRAIGIPAALKTLFTPRAETGVRFFLALFICLGPLITLIGKVTPLEYPDSYNNIVWFYVQSKYVFWVFVVEAVWRFLRGRPRFWQALILCVLLGLSLPSTIQFFGYRMSASLNVLNKRELSLIDFLKQNCVDGDIVMSRKKIARVIVAMTTCRVTLLPLYTDFFVSHDSLTQRQRDMRTFWRDWNSKKIRVDILEQYNVNYLVIDKRSGDFLPVARSQLREYDKSTEPEYLELCFKNDCFMAYKVSR